MNKSMSEKGMLLSMLSGIYDQLEELELVLETSFSALRNSLNNDELDKITVSEQKLAFIENEYFNEHSHPASVITDLSVGQTQGALKLELGF